MLDTKTVRLVIILGMFLVFTGDYSSLIASVWGGNNSDDVNRTDGALDKALPEGAAKEGLSFERFFGGSSKDLDEDDGTGI